MTFYEFIFKYQYLTIPFAAWAFAQGLKFFIDYVINKDIDWRRLLGSGGMPSSHSAFVISLASVAGIDMGMDSPLFGITIAFALVVMYDAAGVRRAAGKQARVLNRLFHHSEGKLHLDEELKELIGHTPVEVIAGALLGLAITVLFMVVIK